MTIKNAKYNKDAINGENISISCQIDDRFFCVPLSDKNRHYQEILKWVEEGNTIEEAD